MAIDSERISIENEILKRLEGKIFLLQDLTRKRDIIFEAFLEVYNAPSYRRYIRSMKNLDMDTFFREFMSYGIIQEYLDDPEVEDIIINNLYPIYVHKTVKGLIRTDKIFSSREELDLLIKKLIIFSGRKELKKINNVELTDAKGRVNIVLSPFGPQITITRAKEKPLSIIDLINNNTLSCELAGQLWIYVEGLGLKSANILISGGPGSGKSTLMNALFNFMPETDRLVVIEDTLELNTHMFDNCSRLESDEETTLADLVKNSLRMRPDRVIVGEVRGREAQDLMTAMNIGKYCMGTLHAATARETVMRLQNEPMNVPEVLVNQVDVILIMRRYITSNQVKRVVAELVEIAGMEQKVVLLSILGTYDLALGKYQESAVSSVFRDKLAAVSGKIPRDIIDEIKIRANILRTLAEKNISDFKEVTNFCRQYALDQSAALNSLGVKREDLLHLPPK